MPIVSARMQPAGMHRLVAMPFGFSDAPWKLMGLGIERMKVIALWGASAPDAVGCNARLADRSLAALALGPEAFAEDCRRAALMVSSRTAPPDCPTMAVDRSVRLRSGAIALRRNGAGWEITPARPNGYDRPWA